jgi:hypothetical protein
VELYELATKRHKSHKREAEQIFFLCLLCLFVAILLGTHQTSSHEPVTTKIRFNKEIVRIFQDHCLACHQPGSNTKIFLHNYAVARPWARAIKEEVLERRMPPSQVVKGFGQFEDDYGLTQHEVDQIVAWVDGGTPKGDDKDLPPDQVRPINKEADDARIKKIALRATDEVPAGAKRFRIESSVRISTPTEAIAIRPLLFPFAQSLEVTAYRPDGTSEVLVWAQGDAHERRYDWQPAFIFREPVRLPKGTRIRAVAYINNANSRLYLRSPLCELSLTLQGLQGRLSHKRQPSAFVVSPPGAEVYTCPMHPDVITDDPGRCPKCAMTLVKTGRPETADFDLSLRTKPSLIKAGQTFRLVFNIHHPKSGATVKDFHIVHEMPFHLFIVSQDLNHFAHLHPRQQGDGSFVIETTLPKPGAYLLYSDVFPVGGVPQVAYGNLVTAGYHADLFSARAVIKPDEVLTRELESMRFALTLEPREPVAGKKLTLTYQITDLKTGEPVRDLEPYLGAWGHTLILSEDARDYVHSHPAQSRDSSEVSFEAFLPRSGRYRILSQFQRHGKVITVPFTIEVKPY